MRNIASCIPPSTRYNIISDCGCRFRFTEQLTTALWYVGMDGLVAQRLEQRTHNPLVVGSNPTGPTNCFTNLGFRGFIPVPDATDGLSCFPPIGANLSAAYTPTPEDP
jgi:hypothetical protein